MTHQALQLRSSSRRSRKRAPRVDPHAGHAAHFLSRLDRLSLPDVERALALYNDNELLRATLQRAKLPDGAERVAISLDHAELGPFLVVTRTGRFVTCLGRGMSVGGLSIVTRSQLDAAAREVERMRDVLARAADAAANEGLVHKHFRELLRGGEYVSREQFDAVARWEPLLTDTLFDLTLELSRDLVRARELIREIHRPHPRHESLLRTYHETVFGLGHLYVLSTLGAKNRDEIAKIEKSHPTFSWTFLGISHGFAHVGLRALWAAARSGKGMLPVAKRTMQAATCFDELTDSVLGATVIGLRHEKLRAETMKAIRAPKPCDGDEFLGAHMRVLRERALQCFEDPAGADEMAIESGRRLYAFHTGDEDGALALTPEHARVVLANCPWPAFAQAETLSHVSGLLPWLARAEGRDLYLPRFQIDAMRKPWTMQTTIDLLTVERSLYSTRCPRRVEPSPGRNDRCPCQSGRKYKHCCLRAT